MASIRAGKQLKKVSPADESSRGPSPPPAIGGMAGALARALQQRNNVIQQSGECSVGVSWLDSVCMLVCVQTQRMKMNGLQRRTRMSGVLTEQVNKCVSALLQNIIKLLC